MCSNLLVLSGESKVEHVDGFHFIADSDSKVWCFDISVQHANVMECLNSLQGFNAYSEGCGRTEAFVGHGTAEAVQVRSNELHHSVLVVLGVVGGDEFGEAGLLTKMGEYVNVDFEDGTEN